MSAAMKERLVSEASMLSSKQHMASLIIDEASIRPKCIYDRKADAVFGLKDKPGGDTPSSSKEVLAKQSFVLCIARPFKQVQNSLFVLLHKTAERQGPVHVDKRVVRHPHDDSRIILLSFDPCHVLKNVRNQFLERQLTDGSGVISGTFVQELYEHQKNMTIKLAGNLTRKHVYPTNLEKMNVLRAVQIFSPQVCAALEYLEENSRNDPALSAFRRASSTVHFMRTMKDWFDMHDTSFGGTGQKAPIADVDDGRLLWLENDFTCYVKKVQASSVASGNGAFTGETFQALLFTTKSTVETTRYLLTQGINYVLTRKLNSDPIEAVFGRVRYMCGGNDMLDARAVTAALDQIVKSKFARPPEVVTCDTDVDKLVSSLSVTFSDDLKELRKCTSAPPLSVTSSGLAYVGGYIAKLITDFGCESCAMLLTTSDKDQPLYALLRGQERSGLAYPRPEFLALLNGIVTFFEKIAKHLPRTHVLEVLQLLVEPHLEDVPLLNCPESVANSHGRREFQPRYVVRYGSSQTSRQSTAFVAKIYKHPNCHLVNMDRAVDDVAVMVLKSPLAVPPVCLPSLGAPLPSQVTIAGWGNTIPSIDTLQLPDLLKEAQMQVITAQECKEEHSYADLERQICAKPASGFPGVGDSGGPLMTRGTSGEWTLVGVVSWGNETRFRSSPFVFSDVSALLSWIQDVVSLPA
ncbi:hypothetical protein HPB47_021325 [Ixodes persulcatus]|uniref:Uncharacterized protein n=1 Tax=Ixodes persulcatus TaxID=34615 RepID=A0AC60QD48_IXOPE|nr:hypothetical protein HPB47_021325 [Ixodes persulcatus]